MCVGSTLVCWNHPYMYGCDLKRAEGIMRWDEPLVGMSAEINEGRIFFNKEVAWGTRDVEGWGVGEAGDQTRLLRGPSMSAQVVLKPRKKTRAAGRQAGRRWNKSNRLVPNQWENEPSHFSFFSFSSQFCQVGGLAIHPLEEWATFGCSSDSKVK